MPISGPFDVRIMSGSRNKKEYQTESNIAHNRPLEKIRFIEAKTSEKFSIKASLDENVVWPENADFALINFKMDNIQDPWHDEILPVHLGPSGVDLSKPTWLCTQVPLQHPVTKEWTLEAPEFGRLLGAKNKKELKKQLTEADLQRLGSIEITMCFAYRRLLEQPIPFHGKIPANPDVIPEEILQRLSLTHIVKWRKGEKVSRPPPQKYTAIPLDGQDGEIHKFIFMYRTKPELKLLKYLPEIEQPKEKKKPKLQRPKYNQTPAPPLFNPTTARVSAFDEPDPRLGRQMSQVQSIIYRGQSQMSRDPSAAPRPRTATPRPLSAASRPTSAIPRQSVKPQQRPSTVPILTPESFTALSNYVLGPQQRASTVPAHITVATSEGRASAIRGGENEQSLFVSPWPQSPEAQPVPEPHDHNDPEDPEDPGDDDEDDEPYRPFQFPPSSPTPPPPPPRPPKRPKIEPTRNLKRQKISEVADDNDNSSRRSGPSTASGTRLPTPNITPTVERRSERRSVRTETIDLTGDSPTVIYDLQDGEVQNLEDDEERDQQ